MTWLVCAFWLIVAHAVADFSLQGDAMAKFKNRHNRPDKIPAGQKLTPCWMYWLTAHAMEHGGCVALATGSVVLGMCEAAAHWLIDFGKCENWYGPHADQALHVACKCLWLAIFVVESAT